MSTPLTPMQVRAKQALLRTLNSELGLLTGRFLSKEEQLRALSLGEEIDRLEAELEPYENNDPDSSWYEDSGEANFFRRG